MSGTDHVLIEEVAAAAAGLVGDFGAGRVEDYFARFAPDATFVFYTAPERLESRDAYRALWRVWEEEHGFRVDVCTSTGVAIRPLGSDAALFVHDVATTVTTSAGTAELCERESIVFERRNGVWLAVFEHLSPLPLPSEP